jgi:hypothetical protein
LFQRGGIGSDQPQRMPLLGDLPTFKNTAAAAIPALFI